MCGATNGCVSEMGGMRAPALRGSLLLEAATDVVGGGELVMVLRSWVVRLRAFLAWCLSVALGRVFVVV